MAGISQAGFAPSTLAAVDPKAMKLFHVVAPLPTCRTGCFERMVVIDLQSGAVLKSVPIGGTTLLHAIEFDAAAGQLYAIAEEPLNAGNWTKVFGTVDVSGDTVVRYLPAGFRNLWTQTIRRPCGNTKGYSSTYLAMGFANVRKGTQKRLQKPVDSGIQGIEQKV